MEELLEPITEEKLLLFQNESESQRIRGEIETRAGMLNSIARHGLSHEEIKSLSSSKNKIEQFIETKLLSVNKKYRDLKQSGITVSVTLPEDLQQLKNAFLNWESLRPNTRNGDKYSGLINEGNIWKVDEGRLERELITHRIKLYLKPERADELKTLQVILKYLNDKGPEPAQIFASNFLKERFTCDTSQSCNGLPRTGKFMLKYSYFMDKD